MSSSTLTNHDLFILEKIKDPEVGPSAPVIIDSSLPRDPHIKDPQLYNSITEAERTVISLMQKAEFPTESLVVDSPLEQYHQCVGRLEKLSGCHPTYASAKNNIAQALRRMYGDGTLVDVSQLHEQLRTEVLPLDSVPSADILQAVSEKILENLDGAIELLRPLKPWTAISPQAARTLSQAYTQRGAIYYRTAKLLSLKGAELFVKDERRESNWTVVDFEENASRDFIMGGRYGNEVAKALAVAANPTAKLCGEIVREAMKKEYSGMAV